MKRMNRKPCLLILLLFCLVGCNSVNQEYAATMNKNLEWMIPDYVNSLQARVDSGELTEENKENREKSARRVLELSRKMKEETGS